MNDDILTLDKPYHISKEVIAVVTGLCKVGDVSRNKSILNKEVKTLTRVTRDQRALIKSIIKNSMTRYIVHGISYKIFFQKWRRCNFGRCCSHLTQDDNGRSGLLSLQIVERSIDGECAIVKDDRLSFHVWYFFYMSCDVLSELFTPKNNVI